MPKAMERDSNPGTAPGRAPLTLWGRTGAALGCLPRWAQAGGPSGRSAHPRDGQTAGFRRLKKGQMEERAETGEGCEEQSRRREE